MSQTLTEKGVHPKLIEILRYFINLNPPALIDFCQSNFRLNEI